MYPSEEEMDEYMEALGPLSPLDSTSRWDYVQRHFQVNEQQAYELLTEWRKRQRLERLLLGEQ